ncbi:target of Nesh-SH3 isoform X2 [Solea solea]|uniref:target of Nesh-SH3 isoform X2 n=1 Tax=Solea solea TaxID=90069 RepID=UPI00272B06CC|nr:target of Nesh-SH3 isoform X2 [Solea solea]
MMMRMQQNSRSFLVLLLMVFITGIVLSGPSTPRRSRVRRQNMKVRINATGDTIVMKFLRPNPDTKLEGYILGYGSSMFSKQFIQLPENGQPYETEFDAEPKYLIAVQPIPINEVKKQCTGKVEIQKPLHLVIGSVTPTSVLLSWGTLLKTPYDSNIMDDCLEDGHYTVRYRERNRKWNYQTCPTSDTVIDNLKPHALYEFAVQPNSKDTNGIWSKPVLYNNSKSGIDERAARNIFKVPGKPGAKSFHPPPALNNRTMGRVLVNRKIAPKTTLAPTTTTRQESLSTPGPTPPVVTKLPIDNPREGDLHKSVLPPYLEFPLAPKLNTQLVTPTAVNKHGVHHQNQSQKKPNTQPLTRLQPHYRPPPLPKPQQPEQPQRKPSAEVQTQTKSYSKTEPHTQPIKRVNQTQLQTQSTSQVILQLQPQPKPTSQVLLQFQPQPKPTSQVILQLQSQPKPTSQLKPHPKPTSQIKSQLKPQPKPTSQLKPQPKPTSQLKPQPKSTSQLIPQLNPQPKPTSQIISNLKPHPKPTSQLIPQFQPQPKPTSQIIANLKPQPKPTSQIISNLKPQPKPKSQLVRLPQPQPTLQFIPQTQPQPTQQLTSQTIPKTKPQPQLTSQHIVQAQSQPQLTSQPIPKSQPQPQLTSQHILQAQSQPQPTSQVIPTTQPQHISTSQHIFQTQFQKQPQPTSQPIPMSQPQPQSTSQHFPQLWPQHQPTLQVKPQIQPPTSKTIPQTPSQTQPQSPLQPKFQTQAPSQSHQKPDIASDNQTTTKFKADSPAKPTPHHKQKTQNKTQPQLKTPTQPQPLVQPSPQSTMMAHSHTSSLAPNKIPHTQPDLPKNHTQPQPQSWSTAQPQTQTQPQTKINIPKKAKKQPRTKPKRQPNPKKQPQPSSKPNPKPPVPKKHPKPQTHTQPENQPKPHQKKQTKFQARDQEKSHAKQPQPQSQPPVKTQTQSQPEPLPKSRLPSMPQTHLQRGLPFQPQTRTYSDPTKVTPRQTVPTAPSPPEEGKPLPRPALATEKAGTGSLRPSIAEVPRPPIRSTFPAAGRNSTRTRVPNKSHTRGGGPSKISHSSSSPRAKDGGPNALPKPMVWNKEHPGRHPPIPDNKKPNQVGKPTDNDKPMDLKHGDKESILKPFPRVTAKPKQERRQQSTTSAPAVNSSQFEVYENSSIFRPLPTSDVDITGKKRFIGPHVTYKTGKTAEEPCSITSSLAYFPDEEGNDLNVTGPPRIPPTNLTVVTVEGCPYFVILNWTKTDNETREYEVESTTKGPNGEEVSIQTTNQTHTAVENLQPESSYEFKVTPKNELGTGPSTDPVSFNTESADPRVSEYVPGKDAIWTQFPFKSDAYSECNGKQFVKRTWYRKFVGIQLCNSLRYKIYLSASLNGKFFNIGDQTGHGEDHCQFVDSFLDGRTGTQMFADQLPSRLGYFRAMRQEPVHFGEIGGKSHVTYVGWYECGTPIPGRW